MNTLKMTRIQEKDKYIPNSDDLLST